MSEVKIKGMAKKEVRADVMDVSISISTDGETPASAISKGKKETERMLNLLLELGIELSDVSMKSEQVSKPGNYSENRQYRYDKDISFVTSANLAILDALAEGIAKAEINATYNEMFYLSDIEKAKKEVLQEALRDANRKAEIFAETLGQKVVGLKSAKCDEYEEEEFEYKVHKLCESNPGKSLAIELSPDTIIVDKCIYSTWIVK